MISTPDSDGPLLIVRPGISFWIEAAPIQLTSTVSALRDDVFDGAVSIDKSGLGRPIVSATPSNPPSLLDRLLPWRRVTVSAAFGEPRLWALDDLKARLVEVLKTGNDFVDALQGGPEELQRQIVAAESFDRIFEIVSAVTANERG